MADETARRPVKGDSVYAMDHVLLGHVTATAEGRFEVTRDDIARWLRFDAVFTIDDTRVTLVCTAAGVGNYLAE